MIHFMTTTAHCQITLNHTTFNINIKTTQSDSEKLLKALEVMDGAGASRDRTHQENPLHFFFNGLHLF